MFVHLKFTAKRKPAPKLDPDAGRIVPRLEAPPAAIAVAERPAPPQTRARSPLHGVPHIKTYVTAEVRDAMNAARRELGEDAILIQIKRLEESSDPTKRYEVTFGAVEGATPVAPKPAPRAPVLEPIVSEQASSTDIDALRRELAALRSMLVKRNSTPGAGGRTEGLRNLLTKQQVNPDLVDEWLTSIDTNLPAGARATLGALAAQVGDRIQSDSAVGWDDATCKAVILVGPPGCGKTTALIKIALEYGVKCGRPVQILCYDPHKAEPDSTLEATARMLNLPLRVFTSGSDLAGALASARSARSLILVDTSGCGTGSIDEERELAELASPGQLADVHLVLSAAWQAESIRAAVDRFEIFQPSRLLFTNLDQTFTYGPILQEAWRTGKCLSFFNDGPLGAGLIRPGSLESVFREMDAPELE